MATSITASLHGNSPSSVPQSREATPIQRLSPAPSPHRVLSNGTMDSKSDEMSNNNDVTPIASPVHHHNGNMNGESVKYLISGQ
jgi:hypothetical protein